MQEMLGSPVDCRETAWNKKLISALLFFRKILYIFKNMLYYEIDTTPKQTGVDFL